MNLLSALWSGGLRPDVIPPPDLPLAGKLSGKPTGKRPAKQRQQTWQPCRQGTRLLSPHYSLAYALRDAGRPLSITELAAAMGVSVGESSKRVKAARSILVIKRVGRCKMVRLRAMDWPEYRDLFQGRPA